MTSHHPYQSLSHGIIPFAKSDPVACSDYCLNFMPICYSVTATTSYSVGLWWTGSAAAATVPVWPGTVMKSWNPSTQTQKVCGSSETLDHAL